jgi:transposase
MTTMTPAPGTVTGGVDTHADIHVAAAVDHLGGVLGTAEFDTTAAGYRRLLAWLRGFGPLHKVGVEGTGSYGAGLARHLTEQGVQVVEVARPNRQLRRRRGTSDTLDAVAAARAVLSGEATATPKTHDGPVECLRALKVVQRSANKSRTQALNQLRALVLTAPAELRERLRALRTDELVRTCAAFRVAADDDSLPGVVRLSLRARSARAAPRGAAQGGRGSLAPHHQDHRARAGRHPGCRPGRRLDLAGHRRRQPAPAALRSLVRRTVRQLPAAGQQRQEAEPSPTQQGW